MSELIYNKNNLMDLVCNKKGYTRLGSYTDAVTKITFICDKGHKFNMLPSGILKGNKCSVCAGKCPYYNSRKFKAFVDTLKGFELLTPYVKNQIKVVIKCPLGHIFKMIPSDFKNCKSCSICSGKNTYHTQKLFKEELYKRNWILNGEYKNSKRLIEVTCDKGHDIKIRSNDLLSGIGCGACSGGGYNTEKVGYFYLVLWKNRDNLSFLKYGVTNIGLKRIEQQYRKQNKERIFNYKILSIDKFSDGRLPLDIERNIKSLKLSSAINKSMFKDGWSETLDITEDNINLLNTVLDSFKLPLVYYKDIHY